MDAYRETGNYLLPDDQAPGTAAHLFHLELDQQIQLSESAPVATVVDRALGGFGEVYLLKENTQDSRLVAAKTPRRDLSHFPAVRDQFAREATIWTTLPSHPNILPAYDVRSHNEQPFVRMKYICNPAGGDPSLAGFLRSLASSKLQVAALNSTGIFLFLGQLLDVLSFLEKEVSGFVHGDLKPANLLLDREPALESQFGETFRIVLLADFGLAWSTAMKELGRPLSAADFRYIAPEMLEGQIGHKAQDIYALGCTMFEIATGYPYQLYDPASESLALFQGGAPLKEMHNHRPDLPLELCSLIFECVRSSPASRPPDFDYLFQWFRRITEKAGGTNSRTQRRVSTTPDWMEDPADSLLVQYLVENRQIDHELAVQIVITISEANQYTNLGLRQKSLEKVNEVLDAIPDFPPAVAALAYCMIDRESEERMDQAALLYSGAVSGYREDAALRAADKFGYAGACGTLAQLLCTSPEADDERVAFAVTLAKGAVATLPTSAKCWLSLGMALLSSKNISSAGEALQTAHSLDPANERIRVMLAATEIARNRNNPDAVSAIIEKFSLARFHISWIDRFLMEKGL